MIYDQFVNWERKDNNGQLYACCPLHTEKSASFTVNEATKQWYCHGCRKGGAEKEFLAEVMDIDARLAVQILKSGQWPFPTAESIISAHKKLLNMDSEIAHLSSFGISKETITRFAIGFDAGRITIPIFGKTNQCVNVRKYAPPHRRHANTSNFPKVISTRGLGSNNTRFYPLEAFQQQVIYVVEGEKDCLAAISQGFNAVTGTGGSTLPTLDVQLFQGKTVYIMVDTDIVGDQIALSYYELLQPIVHSISRIQLPAKDFSEYYQDCKSANVALEVEKYKVAFNVTDVNEEIVETSLKNAESIEHLDTWLKLTNMTVVGSEPKVYVVPTKLEAICVATTECKRYCALAASSISGKGIIVEVRPRQLLSFVDAKDNLQDKLVQERFTCGKVRATPMEYINVQKIIFQESASFIDGLDEATFEHRYGIFTYTDTRLSAATKYDFVACRATDPRNQVSYYIIKSAANSKVYTPRLKEKDLEYLQEAFNKSEKVEDFIQTYYNSWLPTLGIEGRLDLFGAILLTMCSVTEIPWQGANLKGWLDTICVGDTRTGKSQMAQRLLKKLGLGSYINGENARKTGVIGAMQQINGSWIVTWGAIPLNDRGFLVIDEASGLTVEDIKDLSSTRSSGAVTLQKVVQGEARARTRLLWLTNPRSGLNTCDYYWQGYSVFLEYIPAAEDQARFDLVLVAAREDVTDPEGVDLTHGPKLEVWRNLIATAWIIPAEKIEYDAEFKDAVRKTAKELNETFGGTPIIIGVAVHEKLLRLSCAMAVLSGSIELNTGRLKLSLKHLEFAKQFIVFCLSKATMGYKGYIKHLKLARKEREESVNFVRSLLVTHPAMRNIFMATSFKGSQFVEILGVSKDEASKIMSELVRRNMLSIYAHGTYKPDALLIQIARSWH